MQCVCRLYIVIIFLLGNWVFQTFRLSKTFQNIDTTEIRPFSKKKNYQITDELAPKLLSSLSSRIPCFLLKLKSRTFNR